MRKTLPLLPLVFLAVTLSGCIAVPIPPSEHQRKAGIKAGDVAFAQPGRTTRDEFESKIGKPWAYYADLGVSVYAWEGVKWNWLCGVLIPELGAAGGSEAITRLEILCVEFDEQDLFKRCQIMPHPKRKTTREVAAKWQRSP